MLFFFFTILNISILGKLNLTIATILLGYLIITSLSFKIRNLLFQTFCLVSDISFIGYIMYTTGIKELIILSLLPLFVSCTLLRPTKALIPLVWGILLNYKIIKTYFLADVAFISIFVASYLFYREIKIKEEQKIKEEMEKEFKEKLAIAKRLSLEFAHEIKNPLMSISAAIERIKQTDDPKTKAKMIEVAEKEIEKAARLTSDFLKLDEELTIREDVDLCQLLKELKEEFWQVNLLLDLECEKILIKGNKEKLKRLFSNLFQNSLEANARNIKVSVKKEKGKIKIQIKDDGFGIERENWEKVFLPFFSTKRHGSGLGLTIVKRIAQLHNGDVKVIEKNTIEVTFKDENKSSGS